MYNNFFKLIFTVATVLFGWASAQASASMSSDFNLDSWNGTAILTRADYDDYSQNGVFTVPTIYKDTWAKEYRVIGVAKSAFHYAPSLREIRFEEGCETIEDVAVSDCSGLVKVTFPQSLRKIGSQVFFDCPKLCELVLPPGVESCGENLVWGITEHMAIRKCAYPSHLSDPFALLNDIDDLGKVVYDADDVCFDGDIIYNADRSKIIYVGYNQHDFDIPATVTEIGDYAFANCPYITSVTLPESLTKIGDGAFMNCEGLTLTSPLLPAGLTYIGEAAFAKCMLTSVVIPSGVTEIPRNLFNMCTNLESAVIPESVREIGSGAFYNCSALTSVVIPEHIRHLGELAFSGCNSLTDVTYLSLDPQAFASDAFNISDPHSVMLHVQDDALSKVKTLQPWSQFTNIASVATGEFRVMVNGGVYLNFLITDPEAHTCVLRPGTDCHPGAVGPDCEDYTIYVPSTVWYRNEEYTITGAPRRAFYKAATSGITLHKNIKHIDEEAFAGCDNLDRFVIPENIEKIGSRAFADCSGLSTIEYWTETPIAAAEDIFDDDTYNNANLKTYSTSVPSFAATSPWNKFKTINNGVTAVTATKTEHRDITAIYNLNGIRINIPIENLPSGFYIITTSSGSKSTIFIR